MAIDYASLPWLKSADPTREFNDAFQQGASVAEANARLTEEQNRLGVETTIRQENLQRETTMESQRIANEKAYHDQEIAVRKQGLQQAQAAIKAKGDAAAAKLQSQTRFNALVAGGMSPEEAMFKSGLGTPQLGAEYDKSRATTTASRLRADIDKQRLDQAAAKGIQTGSETVVYPADASGKTRTTRQNFRQPLTIPPPIAPGTPPVTASGQGADGASPKPKRKRYDPNTGTFVPSDAAQ